jgi:hypothetical protein
MRPSKTIARAGHDGDASVKPDCHDFSSRVWFSRHARAAVLDLIGDDPRIHPENSPVFDQRWVAGSSPATTRGAQAK